MQSVLVTIDRHEWYAPPQIYTRDDSSGLWVVKPALPAKSPFLSSCIPPVEEELTNHRLSSITCEVGQTEQMQQCAGLEPMDGVTSMETSFVHLVDGEHAQEVSDAGTKKRRVEEESSVNGNVIADYSLDEPREERLEDSGNVENLVARDVQGSSVVSANASVAERVIEPTLVMFEVTYYQGLFSVVPCSKSHVLCYLLKL